MVYYMVYIYIYGIYILYIWYGYILTWGNQCHKQLPFGDSVICTHFFYVIWGMVYYWVHHIIMIFDAHLFDISHQWDTADNWLIITVLRMIDIQYIHYIYRYICMHTHTTLYKTTCLHMHVICNKAIATVWTVVRYVDIILSCVYIYIYTQYVLCSRVQHLGLMIAGVTTSCQLHQLGNGFFTTTWGLTPWAAWRVAHVYVFHGIKLGGLLKKPWVSPKKSRTTWMIPGFFSHRKASNMWSNSRYVTHWSWSNMASRKLRKRPWCLRLSTGRWRRACILSCRIRGLPFR